MQQNVTASSFHLHKARIMAATLQLPDHFEVVVLGTGLVESIVAAAAARGGHTVLHVDTASYYGGDWASFTLEGLHKWRQEEEGLPPPTQDEEEGGEKLPAVVLEEGEVLLPLANYPTRENIQEHWTPDIAPTEVEGQEDPAVNSSVWSRQKVEEQGRRFSLDLTPRLLYARGDMVELLISSNISRYTEFKSATRVLTQIHGQLEHVPSSRSDVFATRHISVVEKRILMKFLAAACSNQAEDTAEFDRRATSEHKTFAEFLRKQQQLTENLIHFVVFAIAMVRPDSPPDEGLRETRKFLSSLGRFGNTPFLWSMYGSGELPQAFCRLCAVYGGVYYLGKSLQGLLVKDSQCVGIVTEGKRISCDRLVLPQSKAPEEIQVGPYPEEKISRGIYITTRSVMASEKDQLTFLSLPGGGGAPINLVEINAATGACPRGLQVVHASCLVPPAAASAEAPLARVTAVLPADALLYSLTFTQIARIGGCETKLGNVWGARGPAHELDFDKAVGAAREIYAAMYPEEPFLPRAPDPEEILLGGEEEEEEAVQSVNKEEGGRGESEATIQGTEQQVVAGEAVDQPGAGGE